MKIRCPVEKGLLAGLINAVLLLGLLFNTIRFVCLLFFVADGSAGTNEEYAFTGEAEVDVTDDGEEDPKSVPLILMGFLPFLAACLKTNLLLLCFVGIQIARKACGEISLLIHRLLGIVKPASGRKTSLPPFLIGPFRDAIVGLARQPLVNSYARTLPLVWKMGWAPIPEGPLKTELPPLPIEILKEKDVLDEFVRRVNLIGEYFVKQHLFYCILVWSFKIADFLTERTKSLDFDNKTFQRSLSTRVPAAALRAAKFGQRKTKVNY